MKKILLLLTVVLLGLVSCKKDEVVTAASTEFAITATASTNGSIVPLGITKVKQGDSLQYTITPDAGASIDSISVDGKSVGRVTTYTFKNVSAAHTIDAKFSSNYEKANAVNGGILYDKFWATEANYTAADAATLSHLNRKADFYRCKQCHAWDLMGNQGSYNSRKASTSRPNIAGSLIGSKTKTTQQLFDAMKIVGTTRRTITDSLGVTTYDPATNATGGDKMPDYTKLLTDAQIWDIVKFLKEGAFDVTALYDATYTGIYPNGKAVYSNIGKDGNAAIGKTYYTANCAPCHGADGKLIPNLDATTGMTAGKFVRTKPNEAQHKIKFGQLGTSMKAIPTMTPTIAKDLYKALADTVAFPN